MPFSNRPDSMKITACIFSGLVVAGLLGNHYNLTLFPNVDFLFGSVLPCWPARPGLASASSILDYSQTV